MGIITYFLWSPDFLGKDELQRRAAHIPPRANVPPEDAVTSRQNLDEEAAESGDDADAEIRSGGGAHEIWQQRPNPCGICSAMSS